MTDAGFTRLHDPILRDMDPALAEEIEPVLETMRRIVDFGNSLPSFSIFSTSDGPNDHSSAITGDKGTIGVDLGSSQTRLWVADSDGTDTWVGVK